MPSQNDFPLPQAGRNDADRGAPFIVVGQSSDTATDHTGPAGGEPAALPSFSQGAALRSWTCASVYDALPVGSHSGSFVYGNA